jgi:hypothetical protein
MDDRIDAPWASRAVTRVEDAIAKWNSMFPSALHPLRIVW